MRAYLKAFMDDLVIINFIEPSMRMPCKLNLGHEHFVTVKNRANPLQARVELLFIIVFLCTQVSKWCKKKDLFKLIWVLQYIKGSMDLKYTVGADDLGRFRTWVVDASYAVHPDMRSHTGSAMSSYYSASPPNRN